MSKRIMVTGHNGYLGSVLTAVLLKAGYEVVGLDIGYFSECTLIADVASVPCIRKDIRDVIAYDFDGIDAVIHLAALSNDPLGNLNPAWTEAINFEASVRVAESAKAAGVGRFLFSSSCIMYGMSEAVTVNEDSPVDPKTTYARSKVQAERAIARLANEDFSPTFLRNGTIYGISPRMRFDTALNNLVGSAVATGKIVLHGDGSPWRPVAHVEDIARAFLHVLDAPIERIHNQVFNNGEGRMNHQIRELAETVASLVPGCRIECLHNPDADQRTYKTDFNKFARTFPDFRFQWTVERGAQELCEAFRSMGLSREDFLDRRFTRLKWLRFLLESGRMDQSLRWSAVEATS